jgi:hypothetical protein
VLDGLVSLYWDTRLSASCGNGTGENIHVSALVLAISALWRTALYSNSCGGPSTPFVASCPGTQHYLVCLGPNGVNGTIAFDLPHGQSHAVNVTKGSTVRSDCTNRPTNCNLGPGVYAVTLDRARCGAGLAPPCHPAR